MELEVVVVFEQCLGRSTAIHAQAETLPRLWADLEGCDVTSNYAMQRTAPSVTPLVSATGAPPGMAADRER